jgi:Zn-finger nucleic acid-binding protein
MDRTTSTNVDVAACQHCAKPVSVKVRDCAHCGRPAHRMVERASNLARSCPRCVNARLQPVPLGCVEVDLCRKCGGLWFDHSELRDVERLLHTDDALNVQVAELLRELRCFASDSQGALYLGCPACAGEMSRTNHEAVDRIIVHRCTEDGAWLDLRDGLALTEMLANETEASLHELVERRNRREEERRSRNAAVRPMAIHSSTELPAMQRRFRLIFDLFDLW